MVISNFERMDQPEKSKFSAQLGIDRSLLPHALITNHYATNFPDIYDDDEKQVKVLFERILCNVSCYDDGKIRTRMELFNKWTPNTSMKQHRYNLE